MVFGEIQLGGLDIDSSLFVFGLFGNNDGRTFEGLDD